MAPPIQPQAFPEQEAKMLRSSDGAHALLPADISSSTVQLGARIGPPQLRPRGLVIRRREASARRRPPAQPAGSQLKVQAIEQRPHLQLRQVRKLFRRSPAQL